MDVIVGLRAFLAAAPAIAAVVPVGRIYAPILEAKAFNSRAGDDGPAIQLQIIGDLQGQHLRGPDGLFRDVIQVDSWARTRDRANTLGRLVRQRLNGFKGVWTATGSPTPTLTVQGIFFVEARELFDGEIGGGLVRHSADYRIVYRDSEEQVLI